MPRHALLETTTVSFRVPRGHAGFWSIIRALNVQGPWTISEVHDETNERHRNSVADYVYRLARGRFAVVVGRKNVRGRLEKTYRLLRSPADAPSLRRDGTATPRPGIERMWTAMRTLKQFTTRELAFAAADTAPIPLLTAERYVAHLLSAGYLIVVSPRARSPAIWRLRPNKNTGPKAPKILRLHIVFDANRNEIVGGPVTAEELR